MPRRWAVPSPIALRRTGAKAKRRRKRHAKEHLPKNIAGVDNTGERMISFRAAVGILCACGASPTPLWDRWRHADRLEDRNSA
jgi:hypothetical protein